MGVDFITCDACQDNFCDCGPHAHCEKCGSYFCPGCMDEHHFHGYEKGDEENDCPICKLKVVTDDTVLAFLLNELGINLEEAKKALQEKHATGLRQRFPGEEKFYKHGYKAGVAEYAVWKDGEQRVGVMQRPLRKVFDEIDSGDYSKFVDEGDYYGLP